MPNECFVVPGSTWISKVCLFNGKFGIEYQDGLYAEYANLGQVWYELAVVTASKGRFVNELLRKRYPWKMVKTPCPAILHGGNT